MGKVESQTGKLWTLQKKVNDSMKEIRADIYLGDCLDILSDFPENAFDLIITSPPYADRRSRTYGGIKPDKYVEWFLSRSQEMLRVLKPDGTFILNIKEKAINGERHTYTISGK